MPISFPCVQMGTNENKIFITEIKLLTSDEWWDIVCLLSK